MGLRLAPAILLAVVTQVAPDQPARTIRGYEKLHVWAQSVHAHTPGQWDEPARAIAAFSLQDHREALADLSALKELLSRRGTRIVRYARPVPPGSKAEPRIRELILNQVPAILGLPDDPRLSWSDTDLELARAQLRTSVGQFMKTAAMMEADVAIFAPPRRDASELLDPVPGGIQRYIMKGADGSSRGSDAAPVHWVLGCAALDLAATAPTTDEFVRLWYRATVAYQEQHRQYGYARPHIESGRRLLPDDPYIHFYTGVMSENIAGPAAQVLVESLAKSGLYSPGGSAAASLGQAEASFRSALAIEPMLTTARLRLARVMSLRGRYEEAVREIRSILPLLTTDVDRYYAHLFLGADEASLKRFDAARAAYQAAATLFPRAQSPLLALGQLAWQQGDAAGARTAFLTLADLAATSAEREEPWWNYDIAAVSDAEDLLTQVRTLALREKRKLR